MADLGLDIGIDAFDGDVATTFVSTLARGVRGASVDAGNRLDADLPTFLVSVSWVRLR
jgi:hypothetical protein